MANNTSAEQSSASTGRVLRSGKVTNPPISEKAKGKRPMEFEDKAKGKEPMLVKSGALTIREASQEGETGDKRKAIVSEQDTTTAPEKQGTTGKEKSDVDKAQTPPVKRRNAERKIVDEHESTVIKTTSPYALRSAKAKDGASAKGETHPGHTSEATTTKATEEEQPGKRKRGKAKKKPGVVEELPVSGKRTAGQASRKGGNKKDEGETSRKIVKGQSSKGKTSNKKAKKDEGGTYRKTVKGQSSKGKTSRKKAKKDEGETSRKTVKGQSSNKKASKVTGNKKDEAETSRKTERGQSSKGKTRGRGKK